MHAHVYEHATQLVRHTPINFAYFFLKNILLFKHLGVNADRHCLLRGVTTVVDAGSAGAMTLEGLRRYVCDRSRTRVLALLHVAAHGMAAAGCADAGIGGESDHLNQLNVRGGNYKTKCNTGSRNTAAATKKCAGSKINNGNNPTKTDY